MAKLASRRAAARHGSASPQLETEPMCKQNCATLPKLREVCADEGEIFALAISRFVAAGYMTGDVACWDAAHDRAEQKLGLIEGPRLVASLAAVMRALRSERSEPWHFMPASCCRVTGDETELLGLIALARRSDQDGVLSAAARLAGSPAPRLAATARVAGEALNMVQEALALQAPRRPTPLATVH